jgi:hypothetical protein
LTANALTFDDAREEPMEQDATKTKLEISRQLYIMVSDRLFGGRPWLADMEIAAALHRRFTEMGLDERVPDTPGDIRCTALGRELDANLMMVFMGGWDEWEVPEILEMHGLMSADEVIELHEQFEEGEQFVAVLLPLVQRAFREYFKVGAIN